MVGLAVWYGFASTLIVLAAAVGAVERRERFNFGIGVTLVIIGVSLPTAEQTIPVLFVVVGVALVVASTVPLLTE